MTTDNSYASVFISYSRHDGEAAAHAIREILSVEAITVWQDRADMEGGRSWWKQITEALDHVDFMVLVATPGAMDSAIVRREWQYARQQGVCVYPVLVKDVPVDFATLPNWMRKAHFYDLDHELANFIHHLQGECRTNRVPFMAPEIEANYVTRTHEYDQLLAALLEGENPVAATIALRGPGGFGKSTLAAAFCHDDRIITAFDEGILWVTLGEKPDLLAEVTKLYRAIAGDNATFLDVEEASQRLSERLVEMDCVLVIDDVWQDAHLRPFMRGGSRCARIITTRNFAIAVQYAQHQIVIDQMQHEESIQLLLKRLPTQPTDWQLLEGLAKRLGACPLMLDLVNETLRQRIARGDSVDGALLWATRALEKKGVVAFDKDNAQERHRAISRTIDVSMDLLEPDHQTHYIELTIFPQDEDIPLSSACALWGMDEFDAEDLIQRYFDLSLLRFDPQAAFFSLHDVVRDYLLEKVENLPELHAQWVAGWEDMYELPDDYAWRWLGYHLLQAEQEDELRELLLDFKWMNAKLAATDPNTLLLDYDLALDYGSDERLSLIQSALRNASHILVVDPNQFAGQLIGRLLSFEIMADFIEQTRDYDDTAWLEPLTPSLPQAGGSLRRTIHGHRKIINQVYTDEHRAISASSDGTVKLWDLENGIELATFEGHGGKKVGDAVLSSDRRYLVSGGSDHMVRVWDVESHKIIQTLNGKGGVVDVVAITPDGKWILSASADQKLRLWDRETGELLHIFTGHTSLINSLLVSPDGKIAVTGSADMTLRVWDLDDRLERFVLTNHTGYVNAIAISTDSQMAISACEDGTVKFWNLETGEEIAGFVAHQKSISGVAISADSRLLVTGSADLTLKIWDVATQHLRHKLTGHMWGIRAVAITAEGQYVVSAAADHTLKVWDLSKATRDDVSIAHAERVNGVAISQNMRYAISGSSDDTLKVWDLATFTPVLDITGHLSRVNDVVLLSDGQQAVSAGMDGMVRVWDVLSGQEILAFHTHQHGCNTVVLTPDSTAILSGGSDGMVKLWNRVTGEEMRAFAGHKERVNAVVITPDGQRMVSASGAFFGKKHEMRVWDMATGTSVERWVGHDRKVNRLAITPDGKTLVSAADDYTLKVWEMESQTELLTLTGHADRVNTVCLSPDGQVIVSGGDDGQLKLWNIRTGEAVASFHVDDALFTCAMGDDNQTIIAAGASGKVHFFRLNR